MTHTEFLTAFKTCTFTRTEWTHAAHIRMAWLYLQELPVAEALDRVRKGIQKLNAKIGSPDGYHETITVAFVRVIAARIEAGEPYEAFQSRHADLYDRALPALLRHYSKELLMSPAARATDVAPDREPLPGVAEAGRGSPTTS